MYRVKRWVPRRRRRAAQTLFLESRDRKWRIESCSFSVRKREWTSWRAKTLRRIDWREKPALFPGSREREGFPSCSILVAIHWWICKGKEREAIQFGTRRSCSRKWDQVGWAGISSACRLQQNRIGCCNRKFRTDDGGWSVKSGSVPRVLSHSLLLLLLLLVSATGGLRFGPASSGDVAPPSIVSAVSSGRDHQ